MAAVTQFLVFTCVTPEKTKIKKLKFLPLSGKSHICWPVFSLVDLFALKIEYDFFTMKIEHRFFTMRGVGIVSGLRARKYWFALCFRVLSNQYVERSAYANVFKFNRENKRFERTKVNSRCFHWFPVAMLESLRRAPTWRFHTKPYNFQWNLLPNNSSSEKRTSPKLWHVVYLLLFYDISISWLNSWNGKRFYCLRDLKTTNTSVYLSKKISTSVLLSGYVCSYISTNDLFQYQTKDRMLFVRVLCKYHVKQNVLV